MFKMKKKVLKKIIVALCAAAMSVPAAASVGAINGEPDNANHQNQNVVVDAQIDWAKSAISNFLGDMNKKTMAWGDHTNLNSEAVKTFESLDLLRDALDNINNFDEVDEEVNVPLLRLSVKDFNRYMRDKSHGYLDESKLDNIKKRADLISAILNNDDIDEYEEDYDLWSIFHS